MRISDAARCLWLAAATLFAATGLAQSPGNPPRFEVASVKPSPPGDKFGSMSGGPLPPGPYNMKSGDLTRIAWTNVRLLRVLQMAYDLPATQISGPDWLASQMYDIQATMPPGTTVADFKRMVQTFSPNGSSWRRIAKSNRLTDIGSKSPQAESSSRHRPRTPRPRTQASPIPPSTPLPEPFWIRPVSPRPFRIAPRSLLEPPSRRPSA